MYCMDYQQFEANVDHALLCFFITTSKLIIFLHCFVILLHLASSFWVTRPLFVPYTYVSIEKNHCILLTSFELKAILLISSVKRLCYSHLNLCCVFNINSMPILLFLDDLFYLEVELLLNRFHNRKIQVFFWLHKFGCLLAFISAIIIC